MAPDILARRSPGTARSTLQRETFHRQPGRRQPGRRQPGRRQPGRRQPGRRHHQQGTESRQPVELARALNLGHRVLQREAPTPGPTPLEVLLARSDLKDYQRELVETALERADPELDTGRKDVYVEARRRLWYVDHRAVIAHMGRGSGLDEAQIEKAVQAVEGFSTADRLKVRSWLLGDVYEKDKLWFIEGMGKGKVGGFWTDPEQALHESSVLPGTFKSAFAMARAPEIEQPKNLGEVEEILDYWQLAAHALPEYQSYYRQLLARFNRSEDGSTDSDLDPATFLERLSELRTEVAESRQGLLEFGSLADSEDASEAQLESALGRGQEGLGRAREGLAQLAPDARKLLAGIAGSRQDASALLRSEIAKGSQKKGWWQSCVANVTTAVGGFVKKLADPDNLLTALEVGLEIAGAVASGGASLIVKLGLWVKKMVGTLTGTVATFRTFSSAIGNLDLAALKRSFTGKEMVRSTVGALFGEPVSGLPEAGVEIPEVEIGTKANAAKAGGKLQRLLTALAKGGRALVGAYRGVAEKVPVWMDKINLTRYPFFKPMILAVSAFATASALRNRDELLKRISAGIAGVKKYVKGLFDNLRGAMDRALEPVKKVLAAIENPAALMTRLGNRLLNFVLGLLVMNPPSAILKATLRAFQSATGGDLVQLIREKVPILDAGIDMLAKSDLYQGLLTPLKPPVVRLGGASQDLRDGADGLIRPVEKSVDQALGDPEALAKTALELGLGAKEDEESQTPEAQTTHTSAVEGLVHPSALPSPAVSVATELMARSSGRPLERNLNAEMSRRLGHDFSGVEIHDDTAAQQATEMLNARAMTRGHRIFFGPRRFNTGTKDGQQLLAHELVHVVQQERSGAPSGRGLDQAPLNIPSRRHATEAEAEELSTRVMALRDDDPASSPPPIQGIAPHGSLARAEDSKKSMASLFIESFIKKCVDYLKDVTGSSPWSKGEPFQFSWEKEVPRSDPFIYLFYRPEKTSEEVWFKNALRDGKSLEDLLKALARTDSSRDVNFRKTDKKRQVRAAKHVTAVVDLKILRQKAKECPSSTKMIKTSLAHRMMRRDLKRGDHNEWETTHSSYEEDFDRLFGKDGQIEWVTKRLGKGGFHIHVSFPRPTRNKDIDHLLTLVAHLNNYTALRHYRLTKQGRPGSSIGHLHLGVMGAEQLGEIRDVIKENTWSQLKEAWSFKWHFMAIRRHPYKETGRMGIEFRSFTAGEGSAEKMIKKTLQILRNPSKKFSFSDKPKYTLAQLKRQNLAPAKSVLEDALKGKPKLLQYLQAAAQEAQDLPDPTIHSQQHQLLVRWSVPFLDWKRHPAVPEAAHDVIEKAYKRLLQRLMELSNTKPTAGSQHPIQQAIAEWAKATNLWKHF